MSYSDGTTARYSVVSGAGMLLHQYFRDILQYRQLSPGVSLIDGNFEPILGVEQAHELARFYIGIHALVGNEQMLEHFLSLYEKNVEDIINLDSRLVQEIGGYIRDDVAKMIDDQEGTGDHAIHVYVTFPGEI